MHRERSSMSRPSLSARFGPWVAILGAVIATLTFVHKGVSQVEKIPGLRADIDSLKAQAVTDRVWKHDMAYMACVNFEQSHRSIEVLAVCKGVTR
jgi:hypothetical protein